MSELPASGTHYDPRQPWLRDERDDPEAANYLEVYLNPVGQTTKPVFLRSQAMLWIARYFTAVLCFFIATGKIAPLPPLPIFEFRLMSGNPVLGLSILFVAFSAFSIMSCISHARRLNDAKRSPFWVVFIPLPLILAILVGSGTLSSGVTAINHPEIAQARMEAAQKATAEKKARAAEEAKAKKAEEAGETTSADEAAAADEAKPKPAQQRRGPPRKQEPKTVSDYVLDAMTGGFFIWVGLGFLVMLYSTIFVARRQPKSDRPADLSFG